MMWCLFWSQRRALHSSLCLLKKTKSKSPAEQRWLQRQLRDPYVKASHAQHYRCRSAFKLLEIDDRFRLLQPGCGVVDCGAAPGAWSQVAVRRVNSAGTGDGDETGSHWRGAKELHVALEPQVADPCTKPKQYVKLCDPQVLMRLCQREYDSTLLFIPVNLDSALPRGTVVGVDLLNIQPLDGAHFLPCHDVTDPVTHAKLLELLPSGQAHVILSDMAPNASGFREMDHEKLITMCFSLLGLAERILQPGGSLLCKYWDGILAHKLQEKLSGVFSSVQTLKPNASRKESAERYFLARVYRKPVK